MLKVYLIQLDSAKGGKTENIARAKRIILEKKPTEGSLVLLPEMFATGYVPANLSEAAEDFSTCKSQQAAPSWVQAFQERVKQTAAINF